MEELAKQYNETIIKKWSVNFLHRQIAKNCSGQLLVTDHSLYLKADFDHSIQGLFQTIKEAQKGKSHEDVFPEQNDVIRIPKTSIDSVQRKRSFPFSQLIITLKDQTQFQINQGLVGVKAIEASILS